MGQLKLVLQTPEPVRLCEYLRRRIGVSARLLARLKRTPASILCNGVPVRAVDPVRAGDVVVLTMPEQEGLEPNPALFVPSVLETAHYIVYDKPTGMPVHPSARHRRDTLGNYFAASMPGHTFRAVNRLDRDTSGLCMIAKDAYTASALQGKLEKRYNAVLCGHLTGDGTISAPIARTEASIITRCVRQDGQPAVTHYRIMEHFRIHTRLRLRLETGRTHQIRVHMSHITHPLVGDQVYGGRPRPPKGASEEFITALRKFDRQALHATMLRLYHPISGIEMEWHAPIPQDMVELIEAMRADFEAHKDDIDWL